MENIDNWDALSVAPLNASYNVYCDESCHLEHDKSKAMALGAVWCPSEKVSEINQRIAGIKEKHGIPKKQEIKWTKISPKLQGMYSEIVDYFFDDDDLHFRGVVIPDKSILRHEDFNQTHDEWYYKIYFDMLKMIFNNSAQYCVYIDIKDTHSSENARKLKEVCRNNIWDFDHRIIKRIQPIRSDEVQLMQVVDILTGCLTYRNNNEVVRPHLSRAKVDLVNQVTKRSRHNLNKTTLYGERKFNLLVWDGR